MQKEKVVRFMKNKGTLGVLTLCLVGFVAFATYRTSYESRLSQAPDTTIGGENSTEAATETELENLEAAGQDVVAEIGVTGRETMETETQENETAAPETENTVDVSSPSATALIQPTVNFQEDSLLSWPAAGTVLMDYNMDSTVYFETLNQYKYNPAMIISSQVGNQVVASAKGIVEWITIDEETGTTLKLNLGNDYSLIYGQLKEVAVAEGQVVEQGQLLGYVSEPTKYYIEEGSNLYFEMQKDGKPVDPYLYLE